MGILYPDIDHFFKDSNSQTKNISEKMYSTLLRDARHKGKHINILLINENKEDCVLIEEALDAIEISHNICKIQDCYSVKKYLSLSKRYPRYVRPDLILIDANLYGEDHEFISLIKEIRINPEFTDTLIVVLGSYLSKRHIRKAYRLGINSYIPKSHDPKKFSETIKVLSKYWFDIVELPIRYRCI